MRGKGQITYDQEGQDRELERLSVHDEFKSGNGMI